jgi:GAF domain-containing protein
MRNPWLAIDAATEPALRARELRDAWERFIGGDRVESVRGPIVDSWRRSRGAGVDPTPDGAAPLVADDDEAAARWAVHPLVTSAPLIRDCMAGIADDAAHLMVISDADGTLLWLEGAPRVRLAAANSMNFAVGALWSESGAGTNAIGTALAADHAVQVFAAEHFNEVVQAWTCAAAPVHDPETGRVLGIVDLTSKMSTVHPHSFAVAVATAGAVEAQLRVSMHERDLRMRSRYHDLVEDGRDPRALVLESGRVIASRPGGWTGSERLSLPRWGGPFELPSGVHAFAEPLDREGAYLVRRLALGPEMAPSVLDLHLLDREPVMVLGGRTLPLRRRQAEILALLCLRPEGCTTEELGTDLYGDDASNSSVRGEVSRLRKLGVPISTEPYRLTVPAESDVCRVQAMLRRGAVREAAEHYPGPLLPHSDAPGVVRHRDELDGWLRHAVLTGDDREALWAWLQSPAGSADVGAWKHALAGLDFRDPRRSQAAAQLGRLREYGA